jgi:thiamine kinase-like enzyme
MLDPDLDRTLDRVDVLRGRDRIVSVLSGGLTNHNYKVVTGEGAYVVRVSPAGGDLLAIDRSAEYRNSLAAAAAGVGAPVVQYLPDEGILVIGFIEGETLTDGKLRRPGQLARIADAARKLHTGPRFVSDFDMFDIQRRYRALVGERGFRLPSGYDDYLPQVAQIRVALAHRAEPTVPCNNDLLAANFIDDGRRIWIIDYEYSGNNDVCFEFGNLASECRLSVDEVRELMSCYYGRERPDQVARCRLFGLMAHYGWTLWASIQHSTSAIEFDFWSWGMEKYDAAREQFASPGFSQLLIEAGLDE